jgi:CheY-like chemotaxis protein
MKAAKSPVGKVSFALGGESDMASVLVIEDDKSMNAILVSTLTDDDHDVQSVFTGEDAIDLCQTESFDLVITDVRLPGKDGVETIGELKKIHPKLKCIVITGYASEDTPVRAIRLKIDDYLFKPFSFRYFLQSVQRVLEQEAERKSKRDLFSKLFDRFGLSMGDDKDDKLEDLVNSRQEAFRGLFVGTRSGYLSQYNANEIYTSLESLESKFRRLLNSPKASSALIRELEESYRDIHEQLALLEIGAKEDTVIRETLEVEVFAPLFEAIKDSQISFDDLLYAPLLRKTPDSRFETLSELLALKRKLWPGTAQTPPV